MVGRNEVQVALSRIRQVLRRKQRVPRKANSPSWRNHEPQLHPPGTDPLPVPLVAGGRDIRLGLERMRRVVPNEQAWQGVHVGGTNGKGSIVAFLAGLFKLAGLSHGTFTSPAFPEAHHGILINGLYVNRHMYEANLEHVKARANRLLGSWWSFEGQADPGKLGQLSPFELETLLAFHVFNQMRVKYGIVEVGMGGATDATNIMMNKAVTIISKIDLDHQEYLGSTIQEIARVKAGIMRPRVPCIVDYTNSDTVLRVLEEYATSIGTSITLSHQAKPFLESIDMSQFHLEDYQKQNLLCALAAFQRTFPNQEIDVNRLLALDPFMPGRLERVLVRELTGGLREEPVLVDGAHNMLGVEALATHVDNHVRNGDAPVTWVMALSAGKSKPFARLIEKLLRPQDNVAFVEFERGPSDPEPAPAELGRSISTNILSEESHVYDGNPVITDAIQWACDVAGGGPIVVTGSLYLVRDFLKLEGVQSKRRRDTMRPGRSQLIRYVKLQEERGLTPPEEKDFKQARRHWYTSPVGAVRRQYESEKGPQPIWPPQRVPEEVTKLQRDLNYHSKQARNYRAALSSLSEDAERRGEKEDISNPTEMLEKQLRHHLAGYEEAKSKLKKFSILRIRTPLTPRTFGFHKNESGPQSENPYLQDLDQSLEDGLDLDGIILEDDGTAEQTEWEESHEEMLQRVATRRIEQKLTADDKLPEGLLDNDKFRQVTGSKRRFG
ncbi:hypothetical protein S40285_04449 [Stachybotrys chlorohalonatus IBT 40285]|uniref:Uncharacterized protein n=1 Tax=Stachybotrys chlorohalonatus (strain IBT 40285) TaxID=1283841 RepID=A0A084QIR0_STAC4|nr:hypothetical protein S40285_04449 [Stachybotrys chlorohalonata IBT 40285]